MRDATRSRWAFVAVSCMSVASLASSSFGHGSMAYPISRSYLGFLEDPQSPDSAAIAAAIAVGGTQPFYDWHEVVNFHPGSPEYQMDIDYSLTIPDGKLASGGNPKYAGLDLVRDDWPATPMTAGSQLLRLYAPTPHDPKVIHAWITSAEWNTSMPLTWDMMEAIPLGPVELVDSEYRFTAAIPPRVGKHCLYVIWQRLDPAGEGFYSLSDVDFGSGGGDCPADLTGDATVDGADLSQLLGAWGTVGADIDGDGTTNGADLAEALAAWGPCPVVSQPDCDGDGVSDIQEIVDGASDCDFNLIPDDCDFAAGGDADGNGVLDACQIDGLTYAWSAPDVWSGGFIGYLTVTNGSDEMIHGWELAFDTPGYSIVNLWDGVLVEETAEGAIVTNTPWNDHLEPGESITIGFQGQGSPTPPSGVTLNGNPVAPAG
jgi:predicted carbohydrate-binding protein with CBM5 and CBM33 domain